MAEEERRYHIIELTQTPDKDAKGRFHITQKRNILNPEDDPQSFSDYIKYFEEIASGLSKEVQRGRINRIPKLDPYGHPRSKREIHRIQKNMLKMVKNELPVLLGKPLGNAIEVRLDSNTKKVLGFRIIPQKED